MKHRCQMDKAVLLLLLLDSCLQHLLNGSAVSGCIPDSRVLISELEENEEYLIILKATRNKNILGKKSFNIPSCPQGWVPFKGSCYKTGKGIEQWSAAQKSCELSLQRAHLTDIETEEEYLFISNYLKTFNHMIMLWTGLNDKQTEGELRWTDGSAYNLGTVMTSNLPHNETDCYALQMNATGPNYFFTGFFCYIPLPYLCEYEFPSAPEHFGFQLEDVKETEVSFIWSGLQDWMEALVKSDVIIQYQMKFSRVKRQSRILPSNITRMTISGLSPGNLYLFSFRVTSAGGASITLGPVLSAETRPNPPLNATVKTITSREIPLYWTAPDKSQDASFDHYLISYVDVQTNTKETFVVENYKTSAVIPSIKPYHPYRISIQTVTAAGSGSCVDTSISVITAVSPPNSVSINPEDVGEENVTLQWDPPQEQIDEYYILVRSVTVGGDSKNYWVNNSNSFELSMLTPGMTYEIGVAAVRNGNMSELKTIQQTLRPKRVQIVVPYELKTHSVVLYVQKPHAGIYDGINVTYKEGSQRTPVSVGGDTITIENLTPGTAYDFFVYTTSVNMASAAYQVPAVKTCLAPPTNVREGNTSETSVEIVWDRADGRLQNYEAMCVNCAPTFMVQKVDQERAVFTRLVPGKIYTFSIRSEKEKYKDSIQVFQEIQTVPSQVESLNHSKTSDTITVSWTQAQHVFDGYVVSITNGSFHKEKTLSTKDPRTNEFGSLSPGSSYIISVVTTSGQKRSIPAIISVTTYPEPPLDVQFIEQDENSVYVSWKQPRGLVDGYKLTYRLSTGNEILYKTILTSNSIRIQNLTPGTEYIFQIQSLKESESSAAVTKRVIARPAGICTLSLTSVSTTRAGITWKPSSGNFSHYKLTLSNSTFIQELNVSKEWLNYTATDLVPGSIYNITVQRVSEAINGVTAFVMVTTVPERPQELQVMSMSSSSFSLRWRTPEGHVDRYQVDLIPDQGFVTVTELGGGELQANVSNTTPGQRYTVTVSAVSASAFSSPVSRILTTNETNPGAPLNLEGERVGSTAILLSWTVPPVLNGKVLSYIVQYREVCPWPESVFSQVLTYSDSPEFLLNTLIPGSTYNIKVAAENSAGSGLFSSSIFFKTAESVPGLVTNLTASAYNHTTVKVTWFLPKRPNGLITKFLINVKNARSGQLERRFEINAEEIMQGTLPNCHDDAKVYSRSTPSPSTSSASPPLTSTFSSMTTSALPAQFSWAKPITLIVDQLKSYTAYVFEVSAFTNEGEGLIASYMVRMPESVPEDPPQSIAKWNITSKSFTISWDPPTVQTGKFNYRIELYGPSGHIFDNSTRDLKFTYSGLTPYTTYTVFVGAETFAGPGPKTNVTLITPAETPSAVNGLKASEVDSTSVTLSWKSPLQPNGIITQYRILVFITPPDILVQNITLTGKTEDLNDSTVVNDGMLKPPSKKDTAILTDPYEGSADLFSSSQSLVSSVTPPYSLSAKIPLLTDKMSTTSGALERSMLSTTQTPLTATLTQTSSIAKSSSAWLYNTVYSLPSTGSGTTQLTDFTVPPGSLPTETLPPQRRALRSVITVVKAGGAGEASSLHSSPTQPPASPRALGNGFPNVTGAVSTSVLVTNLSAVQMSHVIKTLIPFTEYMFSVAASTDVGEGPSTNISVKTREQVPSSVQGVYYQNVTSTSILVSWEPPVNPNGKITHFTVYGMELLTKEAFHRITNKTSIIITGLKKYTEYKLRVAASTGVGESSLSEQDDIFARTMEDEPESAPQNLSVQHVTAYTAVISWLPPEKPNGIITYYKVRYAIDTDFHTKNSTTTTITLQNLKPHSVYNISVRAYTRYGHGNQTSSVLKVLTGEDAPGSPPYNLTYKNISSTKVEVSWISPVHANGIILSYTVEYWNASHSLNINSNSTTAILSNLRKYTQYWVTVSANTKYGNGNQTSDILNVTTLEDVSEDAIQNLTVLIIEWDLAFLASTLKPNGLITKNQLSVDNKQTYQVFPTKVSVVSISHYGFRPYTSYGITISTCTSKEPGPSYSIKVMTAEVIPGGSVHNLTYQNLSSTTINVSWFPPTSPNGKLFYHVSLWGSQMSVLISEVTTNKTDLLIEALQKYTGYILKVTPATAAGFSENTTAALYIRTNEDRPETPPVITTYKNLTATSIQLFWNPPVQPNGNILLYNLVIHGPTGTSSSSTSNTSLILSDLLPCTNYNVSINAETRKGPGPSATQLLYTDEAEPSASPQNLVMVNHTADTVWLRWDPSPEPNGVVQIYSFKIFENNSQTISYKNTSGLFTDAQLTGLKPHSVYLISVSAFTKAGNGNLFSNYVSFLTNQSVDAVQNLHCIGTSWQSVLIQWDPPTNSNGIITHYIVQFGADARELNPSDHVYTVRELLANTTYTFRVIAATSAGIGKDQTCFAETLPESVPSAPKDLNITKIQSSSVTLSWTRPDVVPGYLQNYRIEGQLLSMLCNSWNTSGCIENKVVQYVSGTDDSLEASIYSLLKFRRYRFSVAASTNAGYGNSTDWISTNTLPGHPDSPPQNVTAVSRSYHTIAISWRAPEVVTGPTAYLIDVTSVDSQDYNRTFVKRDDESKNIELSDLTPFTRYSVIVIAFSGDVNEARIYGKASAPVIVTTLQDTPKDPPKNVTLQKIPDDVTKVYVMFSPPSEPNGDIQFYRAVVYKEDDPTDIEILDLRIIENNTDTLTAVIEGLKGGYTYNISVYAVNGAGPGPKTELKITMDIQAPPESSMIPVPAYDAHGATVVTATTITVQMPVCFFSDSHGPIEKIQVIVAEAKVKNDGNITTWKDAYFNKPRPYLANKGFKNPPCTERMKRQTTSVGTYVLGAEDTCMPEGNEEQFCNGPLKPKKDYVFKFRATNSKGQYTDSVYSKSVTTTGEGLSGRTVEIILAVALCVLSVILLGAAIYAFARIRQKQKEGGTYSPRDAETIDTKFKLDQLITVADLELKEEKLTRYSSFFFRRKEIFVIQLLSYRKSLKPVNKKSFLQHVEDLCANDNVKFQEEFSELPKLLQDLATSDADLPWNRSKNRFTNIKPYNNNRVKLMSEAGVPGSDYINASYVSGYLCPNEFIATQGPLPGTVADFWRMIWETRTRTIAMLTQCFEKGRIRCHQYWPEDNKPVTVFGDIVITKLTEDVHPDWTIRDLKVERHGDCMVVRHFNFTSWPEHGVPESSTALIHFVKLIRVNRAHDNTTIAVHCSAGVGRTGVFIGLDHLVQHVSDHDFVDIYGLVAELRSERMCMVQNLAQYMFLHQCALDLLSSKGNSQSVWFVNYSALEKMDSLEAMEGDVELEWEETTM
ncbi:phosphatidylinositol phosphatase PTPRQ-like [Polyodon spathula]|uniref:phosphatidylinositol phosphatase PTPRQ-like n=1 Tax=Polyodon spathula TaxID=7913 RepID=UPI001B7E6C2D|nr:phosphatidylinositol phosphatase PTPRQ-like [Polyodon spathula]